ncbi:hypothetical protein Val02_58050 [Virgisporangium aliadipatigenens]|uniref:Uncharacterized protein n=1 Tax=Virgisporangium aliadipatigenens TaxID=741659 RepID=A0A8J3YNN7_9ACTN|nr:hypothetical protein [Virgisporangium aliadipatigenens]GIJ48919.1 hypothetical protein Val02_58050 [Virgisporangium aliadipatigenens]
MSNYDPPQQPWGGPPPQDPYGAPQYPQDPGMQPGGYPPPPPPTSAFPGGGYQDPGYPPVSGAGGGYPPPGGGGFPPPGGGFPPPPGGGFPGAPQPPSRGNSGKIIIAIVAVVVLALCCGGGYTAYQYSKDDGNDKAGPGASASATPSATGSAGATSRPSATRTPTAAPTTAGNGGDDPDTFVKGDCFINQGTDSSPALKKVPCTTSGAYEVVAKIPGTADKARCDGAGVGRYDASYTHDETSGSSNDYVLCLRKR